MTPIDLRSLFPDEIKEILLSHGYASYRAGQISAWLQKGALSFDEMTDLSKKQRNELSSIFTLSSMQRVEKICSNLDETTKYLFTLPDGETVESVMLSYEYGYTVCLSTQVGCKMGCFFCASTKAGFVRNLSAGEILLQMIEITRDQQKTKPRFRIGHVVLMGIGEPLDNYDQVLRFIRLCHSKEGFGISYRNISLSTCGIIPQIERLMEEDLPITLSVSLHASNSALRSKLMHVNLRYPLPDLMQFCHRYVEKTKRKISFEYAVMQGVNDNDTCADELIALLAVPLFHLNLIPVNPTRETDFKPASKKSLSHFCHRLTQGKVNVTVRRTLGADIDAACGQLRRNKQLQKFPGELAK